MKKIISLLVCLLLVLSCGNLSGCGKSENTIVVGTMANPGEPILKFIKSEYEKLGYELRIQLFTDFAPINTALAEGSIDVNLFQHEPYLNTYNSNNNTDLYCAAKVYVCNYCAYSKKITSLDDLPDGAKVVIADDASNQSRCLKILEEMDLITLEDKTLVTVDDVVSNPKNLNIVAMSTSLITSVLDDSDCYLGIVNATFALASNLYLIGNIIGMESEEEKMINANILAVRNEDKDEKWLKDLLAVFETKEVSDYINETFKGVIQPLF